MESKQVGEDTLRDLSGKTNYTYSAKYLKGLVDSACELIQIMIRAGYTKQDINTIFGLGKVLAAGVPPWNSQFHLYGLPWLRSIK